MKETVAFVHDAYPDWSVLGDTVYLHDGRKDPTSDDDGKDIPSIKLIQQQLTYAGELERIV